MEKFYVRPSRPGGYGAGDGTSYENAWNGFGEVDWEALAAAEPATLWVCGSPEGPGGFLTVYVELSYLKGSAKHDIEPAAARADSRRESPQPV